MEIEAWFLAEHNHFSQVDPAITIDSIRSKLGFNPESEDMRDRPSPANDMVAAYRIAGKDYLKGSAEGTIEKLDYDYVYIVLRQRIPELAELLDTIDNFLVS
jgi:hypothetical protein